MSIHCDEELFPLLSGELGRDATMTVVSHLRECGECTAELISVSVAYGALQAMQRAQRALEPTGDRTSGDFLAPESTSAPQPPLRVRAHRPRPLWMNVAAAVLLTVVAAAVALGVSTRSSTSVSAIASLHRMEAPVSARGSATVRTQGSLYQMDVTTTGLPVAPAGHYYEVWLLNPTSNQMLPVGVLSTSKGSTYFISHEIMSHYSAVDVSLQTDNGTTAHSATSVLRGSVRSV